MQNLEVLSIDITKDANKKKSFIWLGKLLKGLPNLRRFELRPYFRSLTSEEEIELLMGLAECRRLESIDISLSGYKDKANQYINLVKKLNQSLKSIEVYINDQFHLRNEIFRCIEPMPYCLWKKEIE